MIDLYYVISYTVLTLKSQYFQIFIVVSIRRFELSHHTCKLYNLIYTNSSTKNSSSSLWSWSLASSETKGFNLSKDMSAAFREEGPHEERSSQTPASHSSCQL